MMALIVTTIIGAATNVSAFRLGGYDISFDGVKKHQPNQETDQNPLLSGVENQMRSRTQTQTETREQDRMDTEDISEAIRTANSKKSTTDFMKSAFSEDNFCLETEERVAYVGVDMDGSLELLESKPAKCYRVRTTEQFAKRAWEANQDGEYIDFKEIEDNIDLPYRVKLKAAVARGKEWGKSLFS
ncbi:hypothetical protein D1BOALGB6SA_10350 [Olavius sp. associated proteobacterium Delta 1]|nr:hypothetical protein D1BOALGB6SA_10350 [Olavius sp. associated proteobacterium Delta 1]